MTTAAAFAEFVEARWARLVRSAVLLGCPRADAEDVVQATLVRCLVHWGRVSRADDPDAYVHRMLVNTLTSTRRRRWTGEYPTVELPERIQTDATALIDSVDAVRRLLAPLNQDQRAVVVLRYYADLSERQLAEVFRVPVGTVKSRLSRALALLAKDPALAELRGRS